MASFLSWRAGRNGIFVPVASDENAGDVEIFHGETVKLSTLPPIVGWVDLTKSKSGGELAVVVPICSRAGIAHSIVICISQNDGIELKEEN